MGQNHVQGIQVGRIAAPQGGGFHWNLGFQASRPFQDPGPLGRSLIAQRQLRPAVAGPLHLQLHVQQPFPEGLVHQRPDPQVPQVDLGLGIQVHLPEQAAEAHEVLVLHPTARAVPVHLAGQPVALRLQIGRQLELAGVEAVRGEAHVLAVEPHRQAALRPLKADEHPLALHLRRQKKILDIAAHRVEPPGDLLTRRHRLHPVPGVLHVGVLGRAVSLQLDVGRHRDVRPAAAIVVLILKAGRNLALVSGVVELPQPV